MDPWKIAGEELNKAFAARQNKNEGMSRVCARRAAGMAIRGYFSSLHQPLSTANAYKLLKDDNIRKLIPGELHMIMDHLILRVDTSYQLPENIDLLKETDRFINQLKKSMNEEAKNGK
jgi:hypothetical protein